MEWKPLLDRDGLPSCMSWSVPTPSDDIESWQDGRCAMCRCKNLALVIDHDHDTGLIRGLLCHGCNNHEARKGHWPIVQAWRAGRNPATLLGLGHVYESGWGARRTIVAEAREQEYLNGVPVASLAAAQILNRTVGRSVVSADAARILNR